MDIAPEEHRAALGLGAREGGHEIDEWDAFAVAHSRHRSENCGSGGALEGFSTRSFDGTADSSTSEPLRRIACTSAGQHRIRQWRDLAVLLDVLAHAPVWGARRFFSQKLARR